MKARTLFFLKFLVVVVLFSHAASADGPAWLVASIDEPMYLSLCGATLLAFGMYKGGRNSRR